jgi:acetyltransferase-like isoleucine patch superfamily enzyme
MRRFKLIMNLALILPVYAMGCLAVGSAIAPALFVYDSLSAFGAGQPLPLKYLVFGVSASLAYMVYGFSLLFIMPLINLVLRCGLKAWRGPYFSLEAIRWFIHNGLTYVMRFTFLEFITPTPFNILFYKMMGMKIGRGCMINSTWISDPSLIEIGEKATIGGSVTLVGHYGQGGYLVLAPLKIGARATVGLKATIMGGVVIGEGAKILPMSVVLPKTVVPAGETWGGVPARKIDIYEELKR